MVLGAEKIRLSNTVPRSLVDVVRFYFLDKPDTSQTSSGLRICFRKLSANVTHRRKFGLKRAAIFIHNVNGADTSLLSNDEIEDPKGRVPPPGPENAVGYQYRPPIVFPVTILGCRPTLALPYQPDMSGFRPRSIAKLLVCQSGQNWRD